MLNSDVGSDEESRDDGYGTFSVATVASVRLVLLESTEMSGMQVRQRAIARGCAWLIWMVVLVTAFHANASRTGRMLFSSDRNGGAGIFVMTLDGKDTVALTHGIRDESSPAWSPDGEFFAYVLRDRGTNYDVWVAEADGSNPRQITRDPSLDLSSTWSPDGRPIALVSERDGG